MTPAGMISAHELPPKWGLIEVNERGGTKVVVGAFIDTNYYRQRERLEAMRQESDAAREMFLIVRLFDRVSDESKLVDVVKERNRYAFRVSEMHEDLRKASRKLQHAELEVINLRNELARYQQHCGTLPSEDAIARISTAGLPVTDLA